MASLQTLYRQHQGKESDKWSLYLTEYDRLFSDYRDRPVCLLEIGVQNGGSLELWSNYFPNAVHIVGCDINPECVRIRYADQRVSVVVGDANTDGVEARISVACPVFDLILDDGSHRSDDIVRSFVRYFPRLADGGLFVVEDLHCSYWGAFKGGLYDPASSMAFFRGLTDVINHQHWGIAASRSSVLERFETEYGVEVSEALLCRIHSIEFVNSLCVIRKDVPAGNVLGERVIVGTDGSVAGRHANLNGSPLAPADERNNPWSTPPKSVNESLATAQAELMSTGDQLRAARSRVDALTTDLEHARQLGDAAEMQLAETRDQVRSAQSRIKALTAELESAQQRLSKSERTMAKLAKTSADTEACLQQTLSSTSWRLTKPIRWLQDWNRTRLAARHRRMGR